MFAARREIVATTPYYVPDESLHGALCTTSYRGVDTTVVFPARNDSRFVGAASRSYYADLLNAGVKIYEYKHGLLHTKSLTLDGEVTLIGSANMDRRSFELNYENNILFYLGSNPPPGSHAHTPPAGIAERKAILQATFDNTPVAKELKVKNVVFVVSYLKVDRGWAFIGVDPQSADGTSHYETLSGLLQEKGKRWTFLEWMPEVEPGLVVLSYFKPGRLIANRCRACKTSSPSIVLWRYALMGAW